MEDRPWPEFRRGKPISQVQLARLLKPFGIKSKAINDAAQIDAARQRVETEMHKVAETLYKAGAQPGEDATGASGPGDAGAGEPAAGSKPEDVIDAEYKQPVGAGGGGTQSGTHRLHPERFLGLSRLSGTMLKQANTR